MFAEPENLGAHVNTASHETEPALSPEGFRLVFSSDRERGNRLYVSTAREVYQDTGWDTSNLRAVGGVWWQALLLTLLIAAIAVAFLYYRGQLYEKAWSARFFMGSLLVHLVVLLGLGWWTQPRVVELIVAELQNADPSTELLDDNQHQSHEDGREAYEKVADLQSLEKVPLPDVIRQETDPFSVPERPEDLMPTISLGVARRVPQEKVIYIPPKRKEAPVKGPRLARRSKSPARPLVEIAEPVDPSLPAAVESPAETQIAQKDVEIARRQASQASPPQRPSQPPEPAISTDRPSTVEVTELRRVIEPTVDQLTETTLLKRDLRIVAKKETVAFVSETVVPSARESVPEESEEAVEPTTLERRTAEPTPAAGKPSNPAVSKQKPPDDPAKSELTETRRGIGRCFICGKVAPRPPSSIRKQAARACRTTAGRISSEN